MLYQYSTSSKLFVDFHVPQPGVGPVPLSFVSGSEDVEPTLMQLDRKEKMTYTEQAAKRKHCQRLTRCVTFALYHTIGHNYCENDFCLIPV